MIAKFRANPYLAWGLLFLALALIRTEYGGKNPMSRTALLRAITEKHTLSINDYRDWTIDWAHAPDGNYYSNKAPGPVLLGLPAFALYDYLFVVPAKHPDAQGRAPEPGYAQHLVLMLWMQLVPFFLLVLHACERLRARGVSAEATAFFALAALFGNTAAIYMNTNFGHGVASLLFLGAFLAWWEERYVLTGAFLSWSLLADYGVAFALPFVLLGTCWRARRLRPLVEIGAGALPGALVWCWYHTVCFGSPFRTGNQFTNPTQIEVLPGRVSLWGEYSPLPSLEVLGKLLFGSSRGVLFTQPWLFAVLALPFLKATARGSQVTPQAPSPKGLALITVGSIGGLFWMNGGFGGWHGGWCVGPRYPSVVYPAMAFSLALAWENIPRAARPALWAGLGVALAFRLFSFPFSSLAPEENLWGYFLGQYTSGEHLGTTMLRLGLALLAVAATLGWQRRRREFPFSRESV